MKVYDATSIRNVAVVGHGGCGKTQLVSAMLFGAGTVNRLVEDKLKSFAARGHAFAQAGRESSEGPAETP